MAGSLSAASRGRLTFYQFVVWLEVAVGHTLSAAEILFCTMPARRKPIVTGQTDQAVRALLQKYDCPVPYHAVHTRFLGAIVSPFHTLSWP
jgi:hypothetical protein